MSLRYSERPSQRRDSSKYTYVGLRGSSGKTSSGCSMHTPRRRQECSGIYTITRLISLCINVSNNNTCTENDSLIYQ